jgi:predicted MPP superfamily phosphohydrolase
MHYYLWARLIRDVRFPAETEQVLTWVACGLALSIPLAVFTSRLVSRAWSTWWVTPVYLWIGTSFLLVLAAAAVDVLRLGFGGAGGVQADRVAALVACAVGLGASAWAAWQGRAVRVKRIEIPLKKLPRGLDGFAIVQLSDVHVGPTIGRAFLERVVATANALAPDVVAITGDLVDGSVEELEHDVAPLAELAPRFGTYFVTGNHEYHAGAIAWCEHLGHLGVRVLHNEHVEVGRGEDRIHLAGIDDYESARIDVGHRTDLARAVAGCDPARALVLLAHQPKATREAARHGVDLQLSGHTHGGQLWPLAWIMRLGQPAVAGLRRIGDMLVYVSCGTGSAGPPMRLGAPAEITHLVLRSA